MFPSIARSLGTIKERSTHIVLFPYSNILKMISIKASCDCVAIVNNIPKQQLELTYIAKVPEHLKEVGKKIISSKKSVTVVFTSNDKPDIEQVIVLNINANIMV